MLWQFWAHWSIPAAHSLTSGRDDRVNMLDGWSIVLDLTITSSPIPSQDIACIAAAHVGSLSVSAVLSTLVSSCSTLINICKPIESVIVLEGVGLNPSCCCFSVSSYLCMCDHCCLRCSQNDSYSCMTPLCWCKFESTGELLKYTH